MTSADGNGVYLTHEEHAALLAERDRLREVLVSARRVLEWGEPEPKPVLERVEAALKGDQT